MSEFKEYLEGKRLTGTTIQNYLAQINKFNKKYKEDLSKAKEFVLSSPVSLRKAAMAHYLVYLNKEEIHAEIKKIKVRGGERKHLDTLKIEEATPLINYLLKLHEDQLALYCMVIFDTGSRIRAVLLLRKRDIKEEGGKTYLVLHEKRRKIIKRLITPDTYKWLKKIAKIGDLQNDHYLFFKDKKNKKSVTLDEVNTKYYRAYLKLKNISRKYLGTGVGVSFHWLRRGAGKDIYDKTEKDLVAVSDFFGHEDPAITKIYLKIQAEEAEKVIEKAKRGW